LSFTPATALAPRSSVSAQAVEVHSLPDDLDNLDFNSMSIGEDLVSHPSIFDTKASHSFTGSKSFLHHFLYLLKPIPVSVATKEATSFISGVGDLQFALPNGNVILLLQVLYCEKAKATLISMPALRKANTLVLTAIVSFLYETLKFMNINRVTSTVLIDYLRMKLLSVHLLNKKLSPHSFIINTFDIQK
jgi:hypothetical protein